MAKLLATDTAMRVTTDAVQVLGGYGYVTDFPAERLMREAKVLQIVEGTNQIQRMVIGRQLAVGRPWTPCLWPGVRLTLESWHRWPYWRSLSRFRPRPGTRSSASGAAATSSPRPGTHRLPWSPSNGWKRGCGGCGRSWKPPRSGPGCPPRIIVSRLCAALTWMCWRTRAGGWRSARQWQTGMAGRLTFTGWRRRCGGADWMSAKQLHADLLPGWAATGAAATVLTSTPSRNQSSRALAPRHRPRWRELRRRPGCAAAARAGRPLSDPAIRWQSTRRRPRPGSGSVPTPGRRHAWRAHLPRARHCHPRAPAWRRPVGR